MTECMTDRAVYLGDGIWWQVSERLAQSNPEILRRLPTRIRPIDPPRDGLGKFVKGVR